MLSLTRVATAMAPLHINSTLAKTGVVTSEWDIAVSDLTMPLVGRIQILGIWLRKVKQF